MKISVNPHFEDFVFNWSYKIYLLLGGYGSSKSYHVAMKIILKCLEEKRKVLVVREVYETMRESCFDLLCEILEDMNLLADEGYRGKKNRLKAVAKTSPLQISFPNGSKIIFKGMDKPKKLKSMNGVSIVWMEECPEIKYEGYKEMLGRIRHSYLKIHFILSCNPVDEQSWVYKHFFINEEEKIRVLDPERLYEKRRIRKKGVYYHHSLPDDNLFLPRSYIDTLDEMAQYDPDLHRVARMGRFGTNGVRVLPQLAKMGHKQVMENVSSISEEFQFAGLDFGFETSYNALIRCAVDDDKKILYVWHEYYQNHKTDPETAKDIQYMKNVVITADSEDPKAIKYYNMSGFRMRGCKKFAGSRISNIRKMKRFKQIVISDDCPNVWRELKDLTFKKDTNGTIYYDQFNIDPHTFSAMWYALDKYVVADLKLSPRNSLKGAS